MYILKLFLVVLSPIGRCVSYGEGERYFVEFFLLDLQFSFVEVIVASAISFFLLALFFLYFQIL